MKQLSAQEILQERLPLEEPVFRSTEGYTGAALRSADRNNFLLQEVFARTKTDLPKLLAQVRTTLGLSRKVFANAAGMSGNGYIPMEADKAPGAIPQRDKYTKALDMWRTRNVSEGIREQCLELLSEEPTLQALYHRVGYDLGHAHVEGHFPHLYNTLWQRKQIGTVPDFAEVYEHMNTLYPKNKGASTKAQVQNERRNMRLQQAETLWTAERHGQLEQRGIEEPMRVLLAAMEKYIAIHHGETLTLKSAQDHFQLTPKHVTALLRTEYLPWEVVAPLAHKVLPEQEIEQLNIHWNIMCVQETTRRSFGMLYKEAMEEAGFTSGDIGRFLGVQPPEQRKKGYSVKRKHRYRPDAAVHAVLDANGTAGQVPVAPLIAVVSPTSEKKEELTAAYAAERERYYRRTGSTLHGKGLEMRIARELAGATTKDIARKFVPEGMKKNELKAMDFAIQKLERQERRTGEHAIDFPMVMPTIHAIQEQKVHAALERLLHRNDVPEALLQWEGVQDMTEKLIRIKKGARNTSHDMRQTAANKDLWLRSDLITDMAEGLYVPPLPPLRHMAKSTVGKEELPSAVEADWYQAYPAYLKTREENPMEHPLARVLTTVIARIEEGNVRKFFETRYTGEPSRPSVQIYRLQRHGEIPPVATVEQTLLAAGIERGTPTWHIALALTQGQTVVQALKAVEPLLREQGKKPSPQECLGFCEEDLGIKRAKKNSSM